jgi:aspartate kinase
MNYIFKFGGASVRDAAAVKNVAAILEKTASGRGVVVISAMDKTTNALENVVEGVFYKGKNPKGLLSNIFQFHKHVIEELFPDGNAGLVGRVERYFADAAETLNSRGEKGFDYCYDQVVSMGELVSTTIISEYLDRAGIRNVWADARELIVTDTTFRDARVDWDATVMRVRERIPAVLNDDTPMLVTQGFIAGTEGGLTTTLGREGSDYSAAIFAYCLDAEKVWIWKDVQGVLNADPKFFSDVQKLDMISYLDAIELAYFGASVIHPKTIKPLENKNITLYVKSFVNPDGAGTAIMKDALTKPLVPSFIFKNNQVLISISAADFSFIAEDSLSEIFAVFARHKMKINLMQNSAVSFSVCVDQAPQKLPALIKELRRRFKVLYNEDLHLYTIRHYYASTIDMLSRGKEILLEQRSRSTAQLVMRDVGPAPDAQA